MGMKGYEAATFGERWAEVYDEWAPPCEDETIAALARLAVKGPALELGIGTGRVALPLASRGVAVHGLDASPRLVELLRAKPAGDRLPVVLGDMAEVAAPGPFTLVYVVFNTFFALLTQEDQTRCFQNVARRLTPEGLFLLELFVPDLARFRDGQCVRAAGVARDQAILDIAEHDPVGQRITVQHVLLAPGGVRLYPIELRYAWPSELDLMARLAGLRLRERWGSWRGEPFGPRSLQHISIYERIGA